MPVLGITGGIATGKSSFVRELLAVFPAELFDADASAHELLAGDAPVREAVRAAFGPAAFQADGAPDRRHLRERVFADPSLRGVLESILHPAIRERWTARAAERRRSSEWLLVDIPLLYETAAESAFDRVVVVACAPETQRARMRDQRGLADGLIENMIGAQHDLRLKINSADHVIWNDSTVACLAGQARLLAGWLRKHYG